jgi:predicted RNA-binding Zn-ribbon protein involved in translation (DUF1610 family)
LSREMKLKADRARGLCASCGYKLRGLSTPVCPECGVDRRARAAIRSRSPENSDGARGSALASSLRRPASFLDGSEALARLAQSRSIWL